MRSDFSFHSFQGKHQKAKVPSVPFPSPQVIENFIPDTINQRNWFFVLLLKKRFYRENEILIKGILNPKGLK